ncbi:MAG TPA: indole-3-glycerol phosphate synthase TrpC [Anaerolineales bacterium]|nr:indole-3-glycerol phosphate synthase TrpC [Anaerolineales bacterium]
MDLLSQIFADKRLEVAAQQAQLPFAELTAQAQNTPPPPDFRAAISNPQRPAPRLIAEVKHRSPSKGVLCPDFDPLRLARIYASNGAAAMSVLTDETYFGGHLSYLRAIADLQLGVPLLRKDFIYDRYQLLQARVAGASAALLIVAMLTPAELTDLIGYAREWGLCPLVEVHSADEVAVALQAGADVIGINNRDLRTFHTRLETSAQLRPLLPAGVLSIAESGLHTPADLHYMAQNDVTAVLIGEGIVTAPDIAAQVRMFAGYQ